MTLLPHEIDYPPSWPDRHSLRMQASGVLFDDERPGEFEVFLDAIQLVEFVAAWNITEIARADFILSFRANLPEAIDDFIAQEPQPGHLLDWAMHLELMAAKLREAAG